MIRNFRSRFNVPDMVKIGFGDGQALDAEGANRF